MTGTSREGEELSRHEEKQGEKNVEKINERMLLALGMGSAWEGAQVYVEADTLYVFKGDLSVSYNHAELHSLGIEDILETI